MPPKKTSAKISNVRKTSASPKGVKDSDVHDAIKFDPEISLPIDFSNIAFTSMSSGGYYPFFYPNDNLFMQLLQLRLLSPTQSNCITDKTFYSVGAGLQVLDQEFPKDFDRKINGKNQNIDDVLKAIFESYWQDGNKFIEVVLTQVAGNKYVHAYPHNNLDCRYAEPEVPGDDPTHVIRSKEFRKNGIITFDKERPALKIPIWTDNPLNKESVWLQDPQNKNVKRTVLVVKNEVQGIDFYGLPTNFAGFMQAVLEYNVARFNIDEFENNMFIAGVLTVMGTITPDESKALLKKVRETYTGKGKQRRIITASSEAGLTDTKFTPFQQTHEGHFVEFDKHNEGKIISANHWSKDLLDLKESSGLGKGGSYLGQLFKMKFNTVIVPTQQTVLNSFVFPLMKIIDTFKGTKFYDLPWSIKPVIPVSLEGVLDINSLLTVDEGRQELGKAPDTDKKRGAKLISQVKSGNSNKNQQPTDNKEV